MKQLIVATLFFSLFFASLSVTGTTSPGGVIVCGAGTSSVNGEYTEKGILNGRPFYVKGRDYIWWVGTHWTIYAVELDDGAYRTFEDVPHPAMAKEWIVDVGVAPVPLVAFGR